MRRFLHTFSYVFHPLIMPMLGVVIYFCITPKFVPQSFLFAKLFALTILTIIVPILFYFLMRNLKIVNSIFLSEVGERRIPLLFQVVITLLIINMIINGYEFPELYYFFLGILIVASIAFLLALLKFKVSLHMIGITGILGFVMGLSVHYNTNMLIMVASLFCITGAVASARIQARAHTYLELIAGVLIGLGSQVVLLPIWL